VGRDGAGMDAPDPAGAEKADADRLVHVIPRQRCCRLASLP
jgi:hypothetical protein